MLIGRTDDPQNPRRVAAFEVTYPFGCGSRNPSGPAAVCRANRPDTRTLSHQIRNFRQPPLHPKGRPHTPYDFRHKSRRRNRLPYHRTIRNILVQQAIFHNHMQILLMHQ